VKDRISASLEIMRLITPVLLAIALWILSDIKATTAGQGRDIADIRERLVRVETIIGR
jgi:hypothetical protein